MSMYTSIIDHTTNQSHDIRSPIGNRLLQETVRGFYYKKGGSSRNPNAPKQFTVIHPVTRTAHAVNSKEGFSILQRMIRYHKGAGGHTAADDDAATVEGGDDDDDCNTLSRSLITQDIQAFELTINNNNNNYFNNIKQKLEVLQNKFKISYENLTKLVEFNSKTNKFNNINFTQIYKLIYENINELKKSITEFQKDDNLKYLESIVKLTMDYDIISKGIFTMTDISSYDNITKFLKDFFNKINLEFKQDNYSIYYKGIRDYLFYRINVKSKITLGMLIEMIPVNRLTDDSDDSDVGAGDDAGDDAGVSADVGGVTAGIAADVGAADLSNKLVTILPPMTREFTDVVTNISNELILTKEKNMYKDDINKKNLQNVLMVRLTKIDTDFINEQEWDIMKKKLDVEYPPRLNESNSTLLFDKIIDNTGGEATPIGYSNLVEYIKRPEQELEQTASSPVAIPLETPASAAVELSQLESKSVDPYKTELGKVASKASEIQTPFLNITTSGDSSDTRTANNQLNPSIQSNPALTFYKYGKGNHDKHNIIIIFIVLGIYEIIGKLLTNYIDVCERLQKDSKIDLSSVGSNEILSELCTNLQITINKTISLPDSSNVLITKGSLTQLSQDS